MGAQPIMSAGEHGRWAAEIDACPALAKKQAMMYQIGAFIAR